VAERGERWDWSRQLLEMGRWGERRCWWDVSLNWGEDMTSYPFINVY
jgi:hypothetical protein